MTTSTKAKRPYFGQPIVTRLNCSTLNPYKGKPINEVIKELQQALIKAGGDPNTAPVLHYDTYYGWQLSLPRKLTAEQRAEIKAWEQEQASLKIAAARAKIQKLAAQAGIQVSFE